MKDSEHRYTIIDEDGIAHGSYATYEEAFKHADWDAPVCVKTKDGWQRV